MEIRCRPMRPEDFGVVESVHWTSADQVRDYIDRQGIASMLAFDGPRYVGQLYLQEYDPAFADPPSWDYRIRGDSAAIDAGVPAGVDLDIDGELRPAGAAPDIGADEYWLWTYLPLVLR